MDSTINSAHLKYNQLLVNIVLDPIFDHIKKLRSLSIEETRKEPTKVLTCLRNKLREIKVWNQDIMDQHCSIVDAYCRSKLSGKISFPKLIETSLLSTAKIMGAPRVGNPKKQVEIEIPTPDVFVKGAHVHCSTELFKSENIILCSNMVPKDESIKNLKKIKRLFNSCIEEYILTLLPLEDILENVKEEDVVEEAKQILQEAKDEVKSKEATKQDETKPSSSVIDSIKTKEEGGKIDENPKTEEHKIEEPKQDGPKPMEETSSSLMPPISDEAIKPTQLVEQSEVKDIKVDPGIQPETTEEKGFYKEKDNGFFSDSDLESDEEQ